MKSTPLFLIAVSLLITIAGHTQTVTVSVKNAQLKKVFRQIEQQTGYYFMYRDEWLKQSRKITIDIKNMPLIQALELCFRDQPLTFSIVEKVIVIKTKIAAG